jgi:hypothetical protein
MREVQLNTWGKGMVKDLSYHKINPEQYYDLQEGFVTTDDGLSSFAVTNRKGHKLLFKIPNIPLSVKIFRNPNNVSTNSPMAVSFLLEDGTSVVSAPFAVNDTTPVSFIYNQLITDPAIAPHLGTAIFITFNPLFNTIYFEFIYGSLSTNPVLVDGSFPAVQDPLFTVVKNEELTNLRTIGGGFFKDDFILVTTNDNTLTPDSFGQIWYVPFDPVTETITDLENGFLSIDKHLKFNDNLNLSARYPIRRIISSFETDEYGFIYLTDAYNIPRVFNVLDEFSKATPISNTSFVSQAQFGKVVLNSVIDGGSIPSGSSVQISFRLRSSSGAVTTFAPLSPSIPITAYTSLTPYGVTIKGQAPEVNLSAKSLRLDFSELDTSYNLLEVIVIIYSYKGIPEVFSNPFVSIGSNGTVSLTISNNGSERLSDTQIAEILPRIKTVNDLAVKDNRMLLLGVTTDDLLDFDTRAYRFEPNNGNTNISDAILGAFPPFNLQQLVDGLITVPEDHDCLHSSINPDFTISDNTLEVFNSDNEIGGEGINIKYTIKRDVELVGDTIKSFNNNASLSRPESNPGTFSNVEIELVPGQVVDLSGEFRDYKSIKASTYLRGYRSGEVYPFAIQFFDLQGNPYEPKWIADVRFPFINSPTATGVLPERTEVVNGEVIMRPLYIEFELKNLTPLKEKVSGFTIVRCERLPEDKSILAEGFIVPTISVSNVQELPPDINDITDLTPTNSVLHVTPSVNRATILPPNPQLGTLWDIHNPHISSFAPAAFNTPDAQESIVALLSPEAFNTETDITFSTSDILTQTDLYNSISTSQRVVLNTSADDAAFYVWNRLYPSSKIVNNVDHQILGGIKAHSLTWFNSSTINNTILPSRVFNYLPEGNNLYIQYSVFREYVVNPATSTNAVTRSYNYTSTSNKYYINIGQNKIDYQFINENEADTSKSTMIATGVARRLNFSQYEGNTYEARKRRKYINCSSFTTLRNSTINVFGGDTTLHWFDTIYMGRAGVREIGTPPSAYGFLQITPSISNSNPKFWVYMSGVVEADYNYDLKVGNRATFNFNHDAANLEAVNAQLTPIRLEQIESYNINSAYDQSTNLKVYTPIAEESRITNNLISSVWPSERKILGEISDSWRIFRPANIYDLDYIYGPIQRGEIFNDNLFTFQNRAIAVIPINERVMLNDETNTALVLGSGDIVGAHKYLSIESGTTQPFSIVKTDNALYFYDSRLGRISSLSSNGGSPISIQTGMDSHVRGLVNQSNIINTFDPLNRIGIIAAADKRLNRIFFTIHNGKSLNSTETLIYNELMQTFELRSLADTPLCYISNQRDILVVQGDNEVFLSNAGPFGSFFGNDPIPMKLQFIINTNPEITKIYNNLEWTSEAYDSNGLDLFNTTINKIRVFNNYQSTNVLTNIKGRFRKWRHTIGRESNTLSRIQSPYAVVEMIFDNDGTSRIILHDVISHFNLYPIL